VQKVFAVDALTSSHPLSRPEEEVNEPAEISEMFNTISYSKVCSSGVFTQQKYIIRSFLYSHGMYYNFALALFCFYLKNYRWYG